VDACMACLTRVHFNGESFTKFGNEKESLIPCQDEFVITESYIASLLYMNEWRDDGLNVFSQNIVNFVYLMRNNYCNG
jgi:hypothetical protein